MYNCAQRTRNIRMALKVCYLCNQFVDGSTSSGDHVIPRTLLGNQQPKKKGFDYAGVLPTHPKCNNQFGDETYVRKAMHLSEALNDSNTTLTLPSPGKLKGQIFWLKEEKFTEFTPRDLRFFGIHDAKNDPIASLDKPEYYADKPRANFWKTIICTTLSVLTKSAAAFLVKRCLSEMPKNWNVVCVPSVDDITKSELSSLFRETKPFTKKIQVAAERFEASSWVVLYATSTMSVLFFFLMEDDSQFVTGIQDKFSIEKCFRFEGETLMELVGHNWPSIGHT